MNVLLIIVPIYLGLCLMFWSWGAHPPTPKP